MSAVTTQLAPSTPPATDRLANIALAPLVGIGIAHVVLALVMRSLPVVATLHALVSVVIGLYVAARRPARDAAVAVAYLTGAELLWRMSRAGVFWEYGKYGVSAVLLVALMRMRTKYNRVLALGYLILLTPSIALTLSGTNFDLARKYVSFNLSGPIALCVCVLFFSNIRLTERDLRRVFLAFIAPVIGISTLTYLSTATTAQIEFTNASNFATSGGFSATQVSPILGLAMLFSILLLFEKKLAWRLRAPLIGLALLFAVQAALTFSRGGLALAFAAGLCASLYLVRDARTRVTLLVLGGLFFAVGKYAVVPRLEEFTRGKFSQRYSSADSSGRNLLAGYDLQIFADNVVLGVGPGMATPLRSEMGHGGSAHTEFTRMLSEHGILGALALVFLLVLMARTFLEARSLRARTLTTAMIVWVILFFAIYAMRIVAPAFLFGLACGIARSSQSLTKVPPLVGSANAREGRSSARTANRIRRAEATTADAAS